MHGRRVPDRMAGHRRAHPRPMAVDRRSRRLSRSARLRLGQQGGGAEARRVARLLHAQLANRGRPWLHWLMGIYLENKRESKAAQEEYLECLKVSPGSPDVAVRMAAENAPQLFDAAVRWARLNGTTAKSADEAVQSGRSAARSGRNCPAVRHAAASTPLRSGGGPSPGLSLGRGERAKEASRESTRPLPTPKRRKTRDPERPTTCSIRADYFYQLMASTDRASPHADPNWWKGYLGRAELYLDRVTILEDEVRALLSGTAHRREGRMQRRGAEERAGGRRATLTPLKPPWI